jgi:hypothetical protein
MYHRRAIGHLARANEILARADSHSAEVELKFGRRDNAEHNDVKSNNVTTAKGFVAWINRKEKKGGEKIDMRDGFDEYMDAEDEKKRVKTAKAKSGEYTVLVREDQDSNLYIIEDDPVMKNLKISKEVNDMIAKQKRTLLVISDKKAGLSYRDSNRRWLVLEYGSEKKLLHAQKESQKVPKDESAEQRPVRLCKSTENQSVFYYNDNKRQHEARGAVLSLVVDSELRKLL